MQNMQIYGKSPKAIGLKKHYHDPRTCDESWLEPREVPLYTVCQWIRGSSGASLSAYLENISESQKYGCGSAFVALSAECKNSYHSLGMYYVRGTLLSALRIPRLHLIHTTSSTHSLARSAPSALPQTSHVSLSPSSRCHSKVTFSASAPLATFKMSLY